MDITQDEGLPIERVDEGQNKGVIRQIAKEVASILTENEKMLYIAHQGKTVFGQKRDAVIATNNRMIIFKRQRFRGFVFDDFLWEDVKDVDIDQWMLSATIKCTLTDGELLYGAGVSQGASPRGLCDMPTKGAGMAGTAACTANGRRPR